MKKPPRGGLFHFSSRRAISGEIAARPLSMRDSAGLVTPSCAAASVTDTPRAGSTSSRSVSPGWGGLCMWSQELTNANPSFKSFNQLTLKSLSCCICPTTIPGWMPIVFAK